MPKVLPEYLELRRRQIVDAAAACFGRTGFHQTTMQDICDEAGLSPGAVYRYFSGKEEIIQAMCSRGHEEDIDAIREAMKDRGTVETFDLLVDRYFSGTNDNEFCVLTIELLSEARRDEVIMESIRQGNAGIRDQLKAIVERGQARGEINASLNSDDVARVMMSIYSGLIQLKVLEPDLPVVPFGEVVKALFRGEFWQGGAGSEGESGSQAAAALRH